MLPLVGKTSTLRNILPQWREVYMIWFIHYFHIAATYNTILQLSWPSNEAGGDLVDADLTAFVA